MWKAYLIHPSKVDFITMQYVWYNNASDWGLVGLMHLCIEDLCETSYLAPEHCGWWMDGSILNDADVVNIHGKDVTTGTWY